MSIYAGLQSIHDPATQQVCKLVMDRLAGLEVQARAIGTVSKPLTAPLDAAGYRLTALGSPTASTDAVTLGYLQQYVQGILQAPPPTSGNVVDLSDAGAVTGILPVIHGGTGLAATGAVGYVLTSNGPGVDPSWQAGGGGGGGGTVTSVTSATADLTVATPTTTPVLTVISAPKLTTARTIAGVSFDGTANITLASTNLSDTTNLARLNAANAFTAVGGVNATYAYRLGGSDVLWADASSNTLVGLGAGAANTASENTLVGYQAGLVLADAGATQNTAIGSGALVALTAGSGNTAIGTNALGQVVGAVGVIGNVAIGRGALGKTQGIENTAIGYMALGESTTCTEATAIGYRALNQCTTGTNNVAVGWRALENVTDGSNNLAFGRAVLGNVIHESQNTAFGGGAGNGCTGGENTLVGFYAGLQMTTGFGNTILGHSYFAGSYNSVTSGNYNTSLGYQCAMASQTADNQLVIANFIYGTGMDGRGTTISAGKIGFGVKAPTYNVEVAGTFGATGVATFAAIPVFSAGIGTITTGTWTGSVIGPAYGGTGVANNAASTLTIAGNFATTLTVTAGTSVTLPTSGTLVNSTVTALSSLATVGTITSGTWSAAFGAVSGANLTSLTGANVSGDIPGKAAAWTTARLLAGNSVDGSANVAFANKVIVQGTVDAGLSAAQFLGALGTGIVKNTTTTGVLSIAVAGDFPTLNQSTTGSAATLTTPRAINGVNFDGSAAITVTAAAGTLTGTTLASGITASSLTSVGAISSGTWSGSFGAVSGANLTSLNPANIGGGTAGISVTGSSASCTGNAATATTLQTARTIGGVSFDGSASITVSTATSGFTISGGALDVTAGAVNNYLRSTSATGTIVTANADEPLRVEYTGAAGTFTLIGFVNGGLVGSISYNGSITLYNATSDGRLKTDVTTLTDGLAIVRGVDARHFTWIATQVPSVGFIAQELARVYPHAVSQNADGYYQVDYGQLTVPLWSAVQQIDARVDALDARVQALIHSLPEARWPV